MPFILNNSVFISQVNSTVVKKDEPKSSSESGEDNSNSSSEEQKANDQTAFPTTETPARGKRSITIM